MKKRLFCLLMVTALLLSMMPAAIAAEMPSFSGTCGEAITWKLDAEEGILTISGTGMIPDYSYSEAAPWYAYRSRIFHVVLTEGISGVGDYAFYECHRLAGVDASKCTLTRIGDGAWSNCAALSSISFQPGASLVVGADAFYGCKALTALDLGAASAGQIGEGAFANCTSLKEVLLPKAMSRLEADTFLNCSALEKLKLPDEITYIGKRCFNGCLGLRALELPSTIAEIERYAFQGCGNLIPTFLGDAPKLAAAEDLSSSFLSAAVLRVPYDAKGWSWPICKGYGVELVYPSLQNIFSDLDENAWYLSSIQHVYYSNLMKGMRDDAFEPNRSMTRAQLVTVLYRIADTPGVKEDNPFLDVREDAYYYDAVRWAQSKGIVTGVTSATFDPDAEISRQQMCTILYRYAAMLKLDLSKRDTLQDFADAEMLDNYARDPMAWCVAMGFINGKPGGKLDPKGTATRAEIAKVLTVFDTYLAGLQILEQNRWEDAFADPDENPDINREDPLYLYAQEVFYAINQTRMDSGQSDFQWSDELFVAAQARAAELAVENSFGHIRPDGSSYATIFTQYGITCSTRNEIIAHGYTTAQSLVDVWSTASATKPVISAQVYSTAAVGVYQVPPESESEAGKYYYVLLVIG